MAGGLFDDLIPESKGGGSFDDLIPKKEEDPVRAQVRKELAEARKAGDPGSGGDGLARQWLQGGTFGTADEILAGLTTPLEMIKRGTIDPRKGYEYAKAREDLLLEEARQKGGWTGTGMEIVGGVGTGMAASKAGATFVKPGAGAVANFPRYIADGAAYGALTGFNEGSGLQERLDKAERGGLIGAAIGGAVGAAPIIPAIGGKVAGWVSAMRDPKGFAERQLARGIAESGKTPQQITQEIADANAAGQPFTLADAMGNSGQRLLSTVTKSPGIGRTNATEFLEARQGGQARRLSNIVSEGLGAPLTAKQTQAEIEGLRKTLADQQYGAARKAAGAVDVSPAIQAADDFLQPGVNRLLRPGDNIADNSVESAVRRARAYLTDGKSQVSDFNQAFLAKVEIDNIMNSPSTTNTIRKFIGPIRDKLDDALAASSKPYAQARDTFRGLSKASEAVETGQMAAQRGRTEDVLTQFQKMQSPEQYGFRVGYADKLIEPFQGAAEGVNKSRPLTAMGTREELGALSRYQGPSKPGELDQLFKRIERENRMFATKNEALGNSKTFENIADENALGSAPTILGQVVSGAMGGGRSLVRGVGGAMNNLSGNIPKVREELGAKLLSQDAPNLQRLLEMVTKNAQEREALLKALASGTLSGAGNVAATSYQRK